MIIAFSTFFIETILSTQRFLSQFYFIHTDVHKYLHHILVNIVISCAPGQDKENCQGEPDTQKVSNNHLSENRDDAIGTDDFRSGNADLQEGHCLLE